MNESPVNDYVNSIRRYATFTAARLVDHYYAKGPAYYKPGLYSSVDSIIDLRKR